MKTRILFLITTLFLIASCETNTDSNKQGNSKAPTIPTVASKKLESPQQAQAKRDEQDAVFKKECESADIFLTQKLTIFPVYEKQDALKVNGMKLTFDIFNAASLVTFENLQFEVKYISKSGSIVKKENYTINEPVAPNQVTILTLQTEITPRQYNAFVSTEVTIVGADCK